MHYQRYLATYSLIILNILMYIVTIFYTKEIDNFSLQKLIHLGAINGLLVVLKGEWYRVFTAMFLHGGLMHIVMNMFSLYIIGKAVELHFSKISYIMIYILSGIFGSLVSLYIHSNNIGVGASGAIFGLFGAIIGFFLYHKDQLGTQAKDILKELIVILGINLILGLTISSIDLSAHIGGLFVGIIGGYTINRYPKSHLFFTTIVLIAMIVFKNILESSYVQIYF